MALAYSRWTFCTILSVLRNTLSLSLSWQTNHINIAMSLKIRKMQFPHMCINIFIDGFKWRRKQQEVVNNIYLQTRWRPFSIYFFWHYNMARRVHLSACRNAFSIFLSFRSSCLSAHCAANSCALVKLNPGEGWQTPALKSYWQKCSMLSVKICIWKIPIKIGFGLKEQCAAV